MSGDDEFSPPCLVCGRAMWPPSPTWFDASKLASSPLLAGLSLDQLLRASVCDACLIRAAWQGRICLVTRGDVRTDTRWRPPAAATVPAAEAGT